MFGSSNVGKVSRRQFSNVRAFIQSSGLSLLTPIELLEKIPKIPDHPSLSTPNQRMAAIHGRMWRITTRGHGIRHIPHRASPNCSKSVHTRRSRARDAQDGSSTRPRRTTPTCMFGYDLRRLVMLLFSSCKARADEG